MPHATNHANKSTLPIRFIVIGMSEKPVCAIPMPAAKSSPPPRMPNTASHFGNLPLAAIAPLYKIAVVPKTRLEIAANPISIWRTANAL